MSKWRGFVHRVMAMAAMANFGKPDGGLVASRLPQVAGTPKPRPAGMATEYERNIKPPKKGKGTRKQRKEERDRRANWCDSRNGILSLGPKSWRRYMSRHCR